MKRRLPVALAAGVAAVVALLLLRGSDHTADRRSKASGAPSESSAPSVMTEAPPRFVAKPDAAPAGSVFGAIAWGRGTMQIGLPPPDESEGQLPLRLAVDASGALRLLDPVNGRVLEIGRDGRPIGSRRLGVEDPRDLAIAPDRGLAVLRDAHIVLVGADGRTRADLALPANVQGRSVLVDKNDVFVESNRGTFMRVGDVNGAADPNPKAVPGRPTRDGTGYVKALLADAARGTIHVFVVERDSLIQRFSRVLSLSIAVDGIFLVDTDGAGTIYLGVTGDPGHGSGPAAQLVCLEPRHGEPIGVVGLPIDIGPEAVLDAKALDAGGVVFSVYTKEGLRLERHDCNSP